MTWAMMGAYQIIAHALLLNLLIAVFTNTYTRINTGTSSKLISDTYCAKRIQTFVHQRNFRHENKSFEKTPLWFGNSSVTTY